MPNVRDYFLSEFDTASFRKDLEFQRPTDGSILQVVGTVHFDYTSHSRFVSYFIPEESYSVDSAAWLSQFPGWLIDHANSTVVITTGHPAVFGQPTSGSDLPFSGRVFLYIDHVVADADKRGLIDAAAAKNIHLQIKDREYARYMTLHEKPWAFISHDSRDKDAFVRPLASKLGSLMCPVWYDEFSLGVGDSLRESIDRGLNEASKCIVVLSPNFLNNPGWTKAEFNAAMGKHINGGGSVVLPIWHNVGREAVADYSLLVSDLVALRSDMDLDDLARQLMKRIRPTD